MDTRKPLSTRSNLSRLPMPGVKKRARSPDNDHSNTSIIMETQGKKSRIEPPASVNPVRRLASTRSTTNLAGKARTTTGLKRSGASTGLLKKPIATQNPVTGRITSSAIPPRNIRPTSRPAPSTTVAKPRAAPGASKFVPPAGLNTTLVGTGAAKKRPAWDLKGRLQDMEVSMRKHLEGNSSLTTQLSDYNERIAHLEGQNQKLSGDVIEKQMASETALGEIGRLKHQISSAHDEFDREKKQLNRSIEDLKFDKSTLERQRVALEGELGASNKQVCGLKSTVAELTASQSTVKAELENTQLRLDAALLEITQLKKVIANKNDILQSNKDQIAEFMKKERCHETERRKLHNTIQELKGNIRVFCRVRPLLGDELLGSDGSISHMNFPDLDQKNLVLDRLAEMSVNESVLNATRGGSRAVSKYEFSFDKVFQPESSQADIFDEISQLVQSALDGYNVCIFAYGQTGSGKTFTMEGSLEEDTKLGMIPRTVQQIFASATELQSKGWQYTFEASMLEIYNETIQDLLGKGKPLKHDIKMTGKGDNDVYVSNLTVVDVSTEDKVLNLLRKASENRAVAETKCNERSSRSHSVFQLKLIGLNSITGESSKGLLNLVDLAGSERVKDSKSEGQRLVEAQSINSSLSCLGNVIMALGNRDKHIPYRNSKLTYLLQNSLGGNSKTLMFVNISPKEECFNETLNSLRFATKVNQCNIGTAQKKK